MSMCSLIWASRFQSQMRRIQHEWVKTADAIYRGKTRQQLDLWAIK